MARIFTTPLYLYLLPPKCVIIYSKQIVIVWICLVCSLFLGKWNNILKRVDKNCIFYFCINFCNYPTMLFIQVLKVKWRKNTLPLSARNSLELLDNAQLDTIFQYIYYNPLHVSSIICSSSGGLIVLMQHLVSSLSVSGRPVHRSRENCVISRPVHRTATYWQWRYQMLHQYN